MIRRKFFTVLLLVLGFGLVAPQANAEILAMLNYESKPKDALKALKLPVNTPRREGIAIMDVDPKSANFGKILMDMPLPPDLVAHHIFYNRDSSKAYVTALGKGELRVIDMQANPYRMKMIPVPDCKMGEDVVFSGDNKRWYLTCMASGAVIVGDVGTDKVTKVIKMARPYPHGIALHEGIDRMLVTNTIRHDLKDPGEEIVEMEISTGKVIKVHKMTTKKSPSGVAPVEILFVPGSNPPVAYVTNMFGGTLEGAFWNPAKKSFDIRQVFDFNKEKVGVPLEIYFTEGGKRVYTTTAKPGHFHIFDASAGPDKLKLEKTIATGEGAHHVGFTKDGNLAVVQNSFINLPGMSEGSLSVIDLKSAKVVATIDTFQKMGLNPNSIVLLPEWNDLAGH